VPLMQVVNALDDDDMKVRSSAITTLIEFSHQREWF